MKAFVFGLVLTASVTWQPARADIVLGAPGVPVGSQVVTQLPFTTNLTLPSLYKFVFGGIEAKGNTAGAPGNSGTNGNGGQFHLSATVSGAAGSLKEGFLDFRDVQDYNTSPLKSILITPGMVFKATVTPIAVTLQWKGEGNAKKPDGIFNILGEYQQNPVPPTGSLVFPFGQWVLDASPQPVGTATIVRE